MSKKRIYCDENLKKFPENYLQFFPEDIKYHHKSCNKKINYNKIINKYLINNIINKIKKFMKNYTS